MKHIGAKTGAILFSAFLLFSTATVTRAAVEAGDTTATRPPVTARATEKPSPTTLPGHLEDAKEKVCAGRQAEIRARSAIMEKRGDNMTDKFGAIAERVEKYYTTKVLPTGKVVPNYDALVADVAAKKAIVQADAAAAKTALGGFSCTGDHPKDKLTSFSTDMQKINQDLKNYRTSIKNLITAIHAIVGDTATSSPVKD